MSNHHFKELNHYQYKHKLYPLIVDNVEASKHLSTVLQKSIVAVADSAKLIHDDITLHVSVPSDPKPAHYKGDPLIYPAMIHGQIVLSSECHSLPLKITMDIVVRNSAERNVNIDFDWSLQAEDLDGFDPIGDDLGDIFGCLDGDYYTVLWVMNNEAAVNKRIQTMRGAALELFEHICKPFCIATLDTPKFLTIAAAA
jgi:hypothetical protein